MKQLVWVLVLALVLSSGAMPGLGAVAPNPAVAQDYDDPDYTGEGEDDNEAPPREDGEDNEPGDYYGGKSNRITPRDQLDCANRKCRRYCDGNFCATEEYNRCADRCLGD